MNIILFVLGVFCTIAHGCVPPFNNFRNLHNATHLAAAIADHKANPELAWATPVGGTGPIKPWPKDKDNIVYIPFCYFEEPIKHKNAAVFDKAWKLWFDKIGKPGATTGHRLGGFKELKEANGDSMFCFSDMAKGVWNVNVPDDTFTVDSEQLIDGSSSTMGYIPDEWTKDRHRHMMVVGWEDNPHFERYEVVPTIAHEMGHAFGLAHEHQRTDRDQYVKFQCEHLYKYQTAAALVSYFPPMTMQKLCSDAMACLDQTWSDMGFTSPAQYSTEPSWDRDHTDKDGNPDGQNNKNTLIQGKEYDIHSIMHYYSTQGGDVPHGEAKTIHNSPLVKWKNGGPGFTPPSEVNDQNAEMIEFTRGRGPSDGDLEGIKAIYPWTG